MPVFFYCYLTVNAVKFFWTNSAGVKLNSRAQELGVEVGVGVYVHMCLCWFSLYFFLPDSSYQFHTAPSCLHPASLTACLPQRCVIQSNLTTSLLPNG
jgi:hypothetical protein